MCGRTRSLATNEVIVRQGAPAESFYILQTGSVNVMREQGNGLPPVQLSTLRGGEPTAYFGERSLLLRENANATVVAAEESSAN